jgi:ABC-type branched-subunit amino acid transport system ATPase component
VCSPASLHEIGDFIVHLVEQRPLGVLIVEQNIELMQRAAQRANVVDKGRVTASLGKQELLNTELVASYLAV